MTNLFDGVHAVLFDLDGTLVETNIDFACMKRDMIAIAVEHGLSASDVQRLDILAIVDAVHAEVAASRDVSAADLVRAKMLGRLEEIEMPSCLAATPMPGALELLSALREAGIRVGIVTRNCRRGVDLSLARTGVSAEVLLTRDDIARTKPHPDHLLRALSALDSTPSEAIMVGDHWMDVAAGRAAGAKTVGLLHDDRPADYFDSMAPDYVVRRLAELTPHIERSKRW